MEFEEPNSIIHAAKEAMEDLLPKESKKIYEVYYVRFKVWCQTKEVKYYSESVMLAYFSESAQEYKSSTLWAQYSMLKSCSMIHENIVIGKYGNLIAFLKRKSDGYVAKKSQIVTRKHVIDFLRKASEVEYLMI